MFYQDSAQERSCRSSKTNRINVVQSSTDECKYYVLYDYSI